MNNDKAAEAVRYYTAALALMPDNSGVYNNRARALEFAREYEESVADFRRALALAPDTPEIHYNLGEALAHIKRLEDAVAQFRAYHRVKAGDAVTHCNFGINLWHSSRLDEAIGEFRKAVALKNGFARAHVALGQALGATGQLEEAARELGEAICIEPENAETHYWLGKAHWDLGRLDEAIGAYRDAVRIKQDYPEAHCNLAHVLWQHGEVREGLDEMRRGHDLGSKRPGWSYPSAQWVKDCERSVELDQRLPDFLSGKSKPARIEETVELAELCLRKRLSRAAAGFFAEAFSPTSPRSAFFIEVYSYNAACAAALAGCGQGKDASQLEEEERRRLRRQALDWLRGNQERMEGLLAREPEKARHLTIALKNWLADPDFAGAREPAAQARLPEAERQAWRKLWTDICDLHKRAREKAAPEQKPGPKSLSR